MSGVDVSKTQLDVAIGKAGAILAGEERCERASRRTVERLASHSSRP